jgi:hypothetical protein
MPQICLTLPSCWPLQIPLVNRDVPEVACLGVDDLAASEIKPGGRTVLCTPYTNKICSGQYGQWQVLTGLGGQIHRGMFVGSSVQKEASAAMPPGISAEVDKGDCCEPGERCIAVRDRGRWYVTKLGGDGTATRGTGLAVGLILGGNALPSDPKETVTRVQPVKRATYPNPDTTTDEFGYLDEDYPSYRPFGYTLPPYDPSGAPQGRPIVNDWRKYDLLNTYKLGAKLPRIPDGLCYVRVERPYILGGKSWDANMDTPPPRPAAGEQKPVKALLDASSEFKFWFAYAGNEGLPAGGANWRISDVVASENFPADVAKVAALNARFQFTDIARAPLLSDGLPVGVISLAFSPSTGYMTGTLVKILPSGVPSVLLAPAIEALGSFQVTIGADMLGSYAGAEEKATSAASSILGCSPLQDSSVIVIAINDSSRQGFRAGDLVFMNDLAISMSDDYAKAPGNTAADTQRRSVFRIVGGSAGDSVRVNITSY